MQEEVLDILYRRRYAGRNSRGNARVEMDSIITAQMKCMMTMVMEPMYSCANTSNMYFYFEEENEFIGFFRYLPYDYIYNIVVHGYVLS